MPPVASMPNALLLLVLVYGSVLDAAEAGRDLLLALQKRSSPDHNTSEADVFEAQARFDENVLEYAAAKGWTAPEPATEPQAKKPRTGSKSTATKDFKAEAAILNSIRSVAENADPTTAEGKSFLRMVGMVSGATLALSSPSRNAFRILHTNGSSPQPHHNQENIND